MAEQITAAAAPIVTVLSLGGGAAETGLIQTAQTLPLLIFAIPVGILADRMSRRRVMMCAEALRVLSLLAILTLAQLGLLTWPLIACFILIGACGTAAYSVVAPSLVPALVPSNALAAANSRIELARALAFAGGPMVGGMILSWAGDASPFGLAALLSACALFLLTRLHEPTRPPLPRRHPLEDLRDGARFVFRHPLLRPIFATQLVFNAAFFVLLAVFVPYAIRSLGLTASVVGAILATYGIGMISGALLAGRLISLLPFGVVVAMGPVSGLAGALLMALTIPLPSALLAALSFFMFGIGPIIWVISTTTLRQTITPKELLARVTAMNIMTQGARPVGAALGALLGAFYETHVVLVVAAAAFVIPTGLILMSPVVRLANQHRR